MNPIYDDTWQYHLAKGTVREVIQMGAYRVACLEVLEQVPFVSYVYRFLAFDVELEQPVVSANLEYHPTTSRHILGVHTADEHMNFGPPEEQQMSYDGFKEWALSIIAEITNMPVICAGSSSKWELTEEVRKTAKAIMGRYRSKSNEK